MQIIKNTRSLIVVLTIAALALTVTYVPKSSASDWWAEVEQCVKGKESSDGLTAQWMYDECIKVVNGNTTRLALQLGTEPLPRYNTFIGKVIIISLSDSAQINGVKVNRGNCKVSHMMTSDNLNFPVKLTFGQSTTLFLRCKVDTVREVTVTIPSGDTTYTFR